MGAICARADFRSLSHGPGEWLCAPMREWQNGTH